jgi:molybdopterin converting factor small subunit
VKVTVIFLGPLKDFVGQRSVEFDLPENATYGVLLDDIWARYGERFPDGIWDAARGDFKQQILAIGSGRDLNSREEPLHDGEDIKLMPFLPGG